MKDQYDFDNIMDEFYKLSEEDKEELLNPLNLDKCKDYQFSNQFEENINKIMSETKGLEKVNKKRKNHKNIFKISVIAAIFIFVYSLNIETTYGGLIDIIKYCKVVFNGDTYITTL